LTTFPDKQFICTSHSETLIKHVREKYGSMCLYDLEEIMLKDNKEKQWLR